jgi:hypothetical protein
VWPILYTLSAFAYWINQVGSPTVSFSDTYILASFIVYWLLQFALAGWSWIHFYFGKFWISFVWIVGCLALSIGATVLFWLEGGVLPGLFMTALTVWLLFATFLNLHAAIYNVVSCQCDPQTGETRRIVCHKSRVCPPQQQMRARKQAC